ncbi:MAG: hypothetical protein R3C03_04700 [Pirellulaceae bacterium]
MAFGYRPFWIAIVFVCLTVLDVQANDSSNTSIEQIVKRYENFDFDSDSIPEINDLKLVESFLPGSKPEYARTNRENNDLVLVLIESRLLQHIENEGESLEQMHHLLDQYGNDLVREGFDVRFVVCDLYSGEHHQDGLTLLALRRFLKDVADVSQLKGAVLVGSFPEASIVRRWIWRREGWDVSIAGTKYSGQNRRPFLRIVPESVAPRADIVLADLDGNWESIYQKGPVELESIEALPSEELTTWPVDGMVFESAKYNDGRHTFVDFFGVLDDDFVRMESEADHLKLELYTEEKHTEISDSDRQLPNPMALPDILVSRINPRHVAVSPDSNFRDRSGNGMLNKEGKPQAFETTGRINPASLFRRDPAFERQLLIDYFKRNHTFRTQASSDSLHTASACHGAGLISAENLNRYLASASRTFAEPVAFPDATLLDFSKLVLTPARLKGVSAHSSPWNSAFGAKYSTEELESLIGGSPWRWKEEKTDDGYRYVPSLADQKGTADAYVFRTIYENGLLDERSGCLIIHNGCEVNTPEGAAIALQSSGLRFGGWSFKMRRACCFSLAALPWHPARKYSTTRREGSQKSWARVSALAKVGELISRSNRRTQIWRSLSRATNEPIRGV